MINKSTIDHQILRDDSKNLMWFNILWDSIFSNLSYLNRKGWRNLRTQWSRLPWKSLLNWSSPIRLVSVFWADPLAQDQTQQLSLYMMQVGISPVKAGKLRISCIRQPSWPVWEYPVLKILYWGQTKGLRPEVAPAMESPRWCWPDMYFNSELNSSKFLREVWDEN